MENNSRPKKKNDFYAYAPDGDAGTKSTKKKFLGKEEGGPLSTLFGCCECSVVGCRIGITIFLIVVTCVLSIACSILDIVNNGEDTNAFLFWFFVMITIFFLADTVLIFFLCVKGMPCIPSHTVLSYSLLPFYLVVQVVFVIFLAIQCLINAAQWTVQLFDEWKNRVPLSLDIGHIVVNILLLIVFSCCLCCICCGFLISLGLIVGRRILSIWKKSKSDEFCASTEDEKETDMKEKPNQDVSSPKHQSIPVEGLESLDNDEYGDIQGFSSDGDI